MLRLSPRLFALFALAVPGAALIASSLILRWLGGAAPTGAIGLGALLVVSALIIGAGGAMWTRRSRARLRRERVLGAVNSTSEAVIVTDARGTVAAMNAQAESLTGWAQSDAVGQPIIAVFHLVDARTRRRVVNPLVSALYKKIVVGPSHDALLVGKDGVEWHVQEKAAPIFDDTGSVFAGALAFRTEVR